MAEEGSCATQLINGEGEFNIAGLEAFTRNVKLPELGISYAVVAIIGPQSSGKSTLLNHLFRTHFLEMDASKGRSQTTKGIWIARAVGIAPCTVIMDVEGSDGKERGTKDETAFEKQSALFVLAVSDVILINMWCHDIGREQAANRPLLKTVFQVMMQLFSPRKTTLLFVIRDKTKTPLEYLEASLREDIQQIWDTVEKPQAFKDTPPSDFFNVEVTALSIYELQVDQFNEQVGQLRQQFFNSIAPGGLAGDRRGVVPASGFSNWAEKIWKDIKENRDLDLPAHRVMLASVRCDEIGSVQLTRLTSDESWLSLEEAVQAGPVPGFVQRLSSILETHLSEYDTMTLYYDENVRKTKRQEFESKALQLVHPAYVMFLQHLRSETLESFKASLEQTLDKGVEFDSSVGKCTQACMKKFDFSCAGDSGQQTYWDASKVRGELLCDIEELASAVRNASLALTCLMERLDEALIAPLESLFNTIGEHTWPSIRKLLKEETDALLAFVSSVISGFELGHLILESMTQDFLRNYARSLVEKKSKEEVLKVPLRMKERFSKVFEYDNRSVQRVWSEKEDIRAIRKAAWSASLEVLAVMAVIRLDEKPDEVEEILFSSLMDGIGTTDLLASSSWEKVPAEETLITPLQCQSLWREFKAETEDAVKQAVSAQEFYTTNYLHHNIQKTQKKRSEMAPAFPKYVVLQSKHDMKYLAVAEDSDAFTAGGDQVLSPLSKFNLEKAKTKKGFFNIRSCYNNKYVAKEGAAVSSSIVVGAAEPNEDPSQWSSTLVELVPTTSDVTSVKIRLVYDRRFIGVGGEEAHFTVINWESLMNLPKYVVLKGDNGKYLKLHDGFNPKGGHYAILKFDGSDIGDLSLVHQVLPVGDGTIMMKPMLQTFPSAIHWHHLTSPGRIGLNYPASRFMPVKAGSNSIALRCMDNNLLCRIHTSDGYTDGLVADSKSITKESRFIVEEPLVSRDIFDMDFRLKHARIYDQDIVTMNTRDATNLTSSAETFNLRLTYKETSTRTWDRSLGLKLGSSATMKAGVPLIAEGEVKLSADFEGSCKWGDTQQTSKEMETIHTITVPPKTRVKATLLATKGKCEVPFSYTVRDVLIDGQEFIHILDDGIYTGTNDYNFKVETTEEKLL